MKTVCLFFLAVCTGCMLHAQPGNPPKHMGEEKGQRVRAMFIAYMTEQLNLDETTAQAFWPIEKQMHNDLNGIREMESKTVLEKEEAMLNIKKKYKDRFVKILGEERTNLFFTKDLEFRQKMVERLQKRRMQQGMRGQGQGPLRMQRP
jgi:hypothetical protein